MSSENSSFDGLSKAVPKRHAGSSRSIHPYFGKVDPALSIESIKQFSEVGETVLDPFCGSGTVIHDALVAGRSAIGWDSSPLAVLIATAKVLGITKKEKASMLDFVGEHIPQVDSLFSARSIDTEKMLGFVPSMPRVRSIEDWFTTNSLVELASIKSAIENHDFAKMPEVKLFLTLAFSRIITASSKQQGESTYRKVVKPDESGRVFSLYQKAVRDTIKSAEAFNEELLETKIEPTQGRLKLIRNGYSVTFADRKADITIADARIPLTKAESKELAANLVVTSPPYLMSWDYGLYHKFRFYWLGFNLDSYEETEIGRHLRRKDDDVEKYSEDMKGVFRRLAGATSDNARIVMVNAPSVVYGAAIDTNQLLIDLADASGWTCIWNENTLGIPGPHHGMYGSLSSRGANAPGVAGKREHVLILSKHG